MSEANLKMVQYLNEAHATETALVRVLQSQIAMTPRGRYREALESHLTETRRHADRVRRRASQLGDGAGPVDMAVGLVQAAVGQMLALSKTPLDIVRGGGGEEKVLKNAKDACATESLEIATYTAIERLAQAVGDEETARLAASIRAEEERMLERVLAEIPRLTEAVVKAELKDEGSYDLSKTGAADAARSAGRKAKQGASRAQAKARRTARQARRVPGVAEVEGQAKGAVASARDLPIGDYEKLKADEIVARLSSLSQVDLAKVDSFERRHENRSTVLSRISSLRGREPWPGYDEQPVDEIRSRLDSADEDTLKEVVSYERSHKSRSGVLDAAQRDLARA